MSLYEDLGLAKDATSAEIKRAHRSAARAHHPDSPTGNRDKFEQIQRAYMVLSDDRRRRRYDATGEVDDNADNRLSRLGAQIIMAFEAAVQQAGDRFELRDLVADTKALMKARIGEVKKQRTEFVADRAKHERLLTRLKFSGGGSMDPLGGMLRQRVASAAEAIIRCDEEVEELKAAAKLLDSYGFEFVRPEPAQTVQGFTFINMGTSTWA